MGTSEFERDVRHTVCKHMAPNGSKVPIGDPVANFASFSTVLS
jgi:hypothetical protein